MRDAFWLSKIVWLWFGLSIAVPLNADEAGALPGTKPLTREGDIASQLVEGVDRFLLQELDKSIAARARFWQRDFSSADAYYKSIEPNRKHLAHILGVRDPRVPFDGPEYVGTTSQPALVGEAERYQIFSVRWPAFGNVTGEGLMLVPKSGPITANMVVIPDADQTPEAICGLIEGPGPTLARNLAEQGCRVIVPVLIDRSLKPRAPPGRQGGARLTNREYLYRSAFELGRHLIGYEVQKVLACVDWFYREANQSESGSKDPQIGVLGYGEGGMLALYSAAIDTRIDCCGVHGYFGSRQRIWDEPIDRNVFGLLERYGDAELASMVFPRRVVITGNDGPTVNLPSEGGAPAKLAPIPAEDAAAEWKRYQTLVNTRLEPNEQSRKLATLLQDAAAKPQGKAPTFLRKGFDPAPRQLRQLQEMDLFTQQLLNESQYVRQDFMGKLNTSNLDEYRKSVEQYREIFRHQVIGHFPNPVLPMNPASRKAEETDKWTAYEVTLDVFPDVFAYGVLLLPKDLKPGEKRPVVVCQHGLEGRPTDVYKGDNPAYHDFGAKLAERGFITFAPQNLYIFRDRFRTLQRKANPLGKTLFSVIVP
ncbi:MAG: Dipeptidyl aminopeptidase 4, partial [Planctomycetota bacterium]